MTTNTIRSGSSEDSIGISFAFEDGDADIAPGQPGIFVINSRDTADTPVGYYIPENIPPEFLDPAKGIKGNILLYLAAAHIRLDSLQTADTFHLTIYLKDKAGNESNHITTPDIYLTQ